MTGRKTVRENSLKARALHDPKTEGSSISISSSPPLIPATFPETPGAVIQGRGIQQAEDRATEEHSGPGFKVSLQGSGWS